MPDQPTLLPVTVLIASRGRPEMLLDTVRSILAGDQVPAELVIVDQSPQPLPLLRDLGHERGCRIRYVHSADTRGLSRARNIGLRMAGQEVVIVLDDDMLVEPEALRLLFAGRQGQLNTVTSGRLLMAPPERPGLTQAPGALVTRTDPDVYRGRQPRQVVPGPNISLPRDLLLSLGGYDERLGSGSRFPAGEDHDLSLRLLDAGCEVRHVPAAVVMHRAWRSRRDLLSLRWGYARGVGGFYAKHASLRDPYVLGRAAREVGERCRAVAGAARGAAPKAALAQLITLTGMLVGALEWTARYRLRPRSRAGSQ
jgi:GT2 family glycosyltransferase